MDPVGPWSAYASYNRLAGVQAGASGGELHHHLSTGNTTGSPSTTTTQLLPGGFLSPPPVGYETVFSPLFHPATAKPAAHYVTQHRQALAQAQAAASKQSSDSEYHQAQAFFEQGGGAWQQNSPFGILPHESVVANASSKNTPYENFNAHFAAQSLSHLNSQLAVANAKNAVARARSPHVTTTVAKTTTTSNSVSFFQVPSTFPNEPPNKSFPTTTSSNLQQSCVVTSTSNTPVSKDYRVPQAPSRSVFLTSPRNIDKTYPTPAKQNQPPQIQTKAQTKIYPELVNQTERQRNSDEGQNQSAPGNFNLDSPARLYPVNNAANKRPQFQHTNYRHYQPGNSDSEFQRPKSGPDYPSNGADCNVVVPRKPSPLQAHSQASPISHAQSPAYPMYNSPMNPISSPQQNTGNQVTPPTPLDVSVPRPNSQAGNVAYPSVITRTLNTDKTFPERYDRTTHQNSNCWDERQSLTRKFQTQINSSNYASVELQNRQNDLVNRTDSPQQRSNASMTDRQQLYFDSTHQVPLQDLSSCRGDPMSIVKNLQQQNCHVQPIECKQEEKSTTKRRKSNEKPASLVNEAPGTMEYYPGPIPPPAHSSGTNQQQNGSYFDFDRWNLPTPSSKIFGPQTIHQQHQGLMVPHPHAPPPPLPYFPPFHLPPHPSEFPSSVELTPISTYGEQSPQPTLSQFTPQEEQPKVVVPNIEEELNFLSDGTAAKPTILSSAVRPITIVNKTSDKPSGPGAGFMNSYLKFLQGERDSSPPPTSRGSRKQTWSRSKTFQNDAKPESNGVAPANTVAPAARLSQGDPQDDPRYFPLPKERKKNSFDSSDGGISSDEDFFPKKIVPVVRSDPPKEKVSKKGRPPKAGGPTERKRARQALISQKQKQQLLTEQQQQQHHQPDLQSFSESTPRRETSKRAAKEKSNIKQLIAKGDEEAEEPSEFMDSDSDPAWTPQAKEEPEEEIKAPVKRGKRGRPAGRKKGSVRNLITAAAEGAGIQDVDGSSNDGAIATAKIQKPSGKKECPKQMNVQEVESNAATQLTFLKNAPSSPEDNLLKPGEFVVIKSEMNEEWPAIWRVDGKTLLQKYEPFEQNGQTLYRNISTYTSWTPESKKQYITVPVKYRSQSQLETVVEFLKNEMIVDHEFLEKVMKENEVYQDNFEVYIQTLISQALDSNFLTEIFQEQDDYFLSNVKTIDDITSSKKQKLLSILSWRHPVQIAVSTWPCFNISRGLIAADDQEKNCAACLLPGVSVSVLMYGQPYNSTTLEGCQPDPHVINEKGFLMCRICADRVQLFNKITHQKYLMYIECAKRVAEKRTADPLKDTTCILNELLADENWLNQLFLEVRSSWGEVDSLEHNYTNRNLKNQ